MARSSAKLALRRFGVVTASMRPPPDVLIIGAKRGGTTSAWNHLISHPGVLPNFPALQKIKGTYFLTDHWDRGPRWYRSHFASSNRRRLVEAKLQHRVVSGEACPYYLTHPLAPVRSLEVAPDAIVVAILRNPIERAHSHWKERRARGTESLPFLEALHAEELRTSGEEERIIRGEVRRSFAHRHQTYLGQSCYSESIRRWQEAVGARLVVWTSDDFYSSPEAHINELWQRLGLPKGPEIVNRALNSHSGAPVSSEERTFLQSRLMGDIDRMEELLGHTTRWRDDW